MPEDLAIPPQTGLSPDQLHNPRLLNQTRLKPGRSYKPGQFTAAANVSTPVPLSDTRPGQAARLNVQNNSSASVGIEWHPDIAAPLASAGSFQVGANGGFFSADVVLASLNIFCTQSTVVNGNAAGLVIWLDV